MTLLLNVLAFEDPTFGTTTSPPQAAANIAAYPVSEAAPMAIIEKMRNTIVRMKDKSPYGIAKQKFFVFPVAHPRHAMRSPMTPMAIIPLPTPSCASIP